MKKNNGGVSYSMQELYVIHLKLLNSDVESFQLSLVFLQRNYLEKRVHAFSGV